MSKKKTRSVLSVALAAVTLDVTHWLVGEQAFHLAVFVNIAAFVLMSALWED